MTVSRRAQVRLVLKSLTFVTNEQEFERGPNEQSLVVGSEVLQSMVAWASAAGWRNPDRSLRLRHLPRPAVKTLVMTLREELAAEVAVSAGVSRSRIRPY